MSYDTRDLLARLIQCEAGGEGFEGMAAVASVIMNRATVPNGEFSRVSQGGNVRAIILQPGQFVCAMTTVDGEYNAQNIYNMTPNDDHYAIADWALSGGRFSAVGDSLFFYNPYSRSCATYFPSRNGVIYNRIGEHCFYEPTPSYAST